MPQSDREKKVDMAGAILTVLATIGVITIALVAPNALTLLKPYITGRKRKPDRWDATRSLTTLIDRGFVRRQTRHGSELVTLTPKGRTYLETKVFCQQTIQKPKRWDKKWRLVFFDIPTSRGKIRNQVRQRLKSLGFLKIQKSIYLHPYECGEIVAAIQNHYKIFPHLHFARVERISQEAEYRRHFRLDTSR